MPKEIQQPNIAIPDAKDPFTLALLPRLYTEWIRQVGPQLDIDIEKYILSEVLVNIIGDDETCFTWTTCGVSFDSDIASMAKRNLLERMDWEIGTPETPEMIRERLTSVYQVVSSLNWRKKEEFDQATTEWRQLKKWVEKQIEESPELKEAEKYSSTASSQLLKYWNEFFHW